MLDEKYVENLFHSFTAKLDEIGFPVPAVGVIAASGNAPYRILVSTVISLRTQDRVTLEASERLLEAAPTVNELYPLSIEEIQNLIKPCGFYLRKAVQLKEIARIIVEEYDSVVPSDKEALLSLPGVGTKTANLVLNLSFNIPAICVDCHVHEISTRLGWTEEKTPEETEKALERILPVRFWIEINELFVRYGQSICTPLSPKCSICPGNNLCPKKGVSKTR